MLQLIPSIEGGLGVPVLYLVGCYAFVYIILFLTLWKGVSSSGKVAYFTALFPYVILITLLVKGVTLPGSVKGIMFFITPKWEELATIKVSISIPNTYPVFCPLLKLIFKGLVVSCHSGFLLTVSWIWICDKLWLSQHFPSRHPSWRTHFKRGGYLDISTSWVYHFCHPWSSCWGPWCWSQPSGQEWSWLGICLLPIGNFQIRARNAGNQP